MEHFKFVTAANDVVYHRNKKLNQDYLVDLIASLRNALVAAEQENAKLRDRLLVDV